MTAAAMTPTELLERIALGESQTLEFKTSFDKAIRMSEFPVKPVNTRGRYFKRIASDIQSDNYRSSLRNKLVAEAFYLTGSIEKYGSGFIRIRKALRDYPEIEFEIKEFAGGVMVTFAQKQPESPHEGVSGGVSPESAHLLQLIQAQPRLKTIELVAQTGKPQRTVERWLKQLKDSQRIEFRGAPKTGGYYPKDL